MNQSRYFELLEERRNSPRILFKDSRWCLNLVVPNESLDSMYPTYIVPWDFGSVGISFVSDVSFKLGEKVTGFLYAEGEKVVTSNLVITRIDQIREFDKKDVCFKVVAVFQEAEPEIIEIIKKEGK